MLSNIRSNFYSQVDPRASITVSLAQTGYCDEKGYDPESPLCAHIIYTGEIEKVK